MTRCVFPEPTTTSFEFVRAVLLATGADGFHFIGNTYFNVGDDGGTNVIDADTGIVDDLQIIGNLIVGKFAEGAIHSDKVCTNVVCNYNLVTNLTTGQHAIEFSDNALGFLVGNRVETNAIATAIDNGALSSHDNTWLTPQGADTEAAQVNPTIDSATTILGANDADNAYDSSTVAANSDGSILERLEQVDVDTSANIVQNTLDEKCILASIASITTPDQVLFTVAGGPIKIIEIVGIVTGAIQPIYAY